MPVTIADVVDAEDQSAARFAAAVHQGVAQSLTGVSLLVEALAGDLGANRTARPESAMAKEIAEQLATCVEQVRALTRVCDPGSVTRQSLPSALRNLVLALPPQHRKAVTVTVETPPEWLRPAQAVGVARLAAEAMSLVQEMRTDAGPLRLRMRAADDGLKLIFSGPAVQRTLAKAANQARQWCRLEQRAQLLGGSIAIKSRLRATARWEFTLAPPADRRHP